jgi:hypothetical protein
MDTTINLEEVKTEQLMLEILSRSNDKNEWARALLSIIEAWAKNKSRTEKVNLAAELVDPLVGRANYGLAAIAKVLNAKAEKDGQIITLFRM